jgi:poly-gamma-glutamate synthesis protein (capsule biosynthesis protein)
MIRRSLACLMLAALLAPACVAEDSSEPDGGDALSHDGVDGDAYEPFQPLGKADGLTIGEPLEFADACEGGDELTIAAVGDVLIHGRLQKQAFARADGFASLWSSASDLLRAADISYANLEGPTAPGVNASGADVPDPGKVFDKVVYSSYPAFNYHPSLLDDLMSSGVDVVSTANNHSLDRRSLGADRTVDELRARGLAYTGTRKRNEPDASWFTLTEARGFRIAWLACTYGTNGISDPHHQVAHCYDDRNELLAQTSELAQRPDIDALIVTPHWGLEYQATPRDKEMDLAHDFLDAGAIAVLGSHPHVLQPWERYRTADGRDTFVIYSLGNFVSGQKHIPRKSTLMLQLGLRRDADGEVQIRGARYVPLYMHEEPGYLTLRVLDKDGGLGESRELTVDMFGLHNLSLPLPALDSAPQCDPGWEPVGEADGWIGGSCASELVCGGGVCAGDYPGGLCTRSCDGYCPDQVGRAGSFCVADQVGSAGMCVSTCDDDQDCREGYRCQQRARFGQPGVVKRVCLP